MESAKLSGFVATRVLPAEYTLFEMEVPNPQTRRAPRASACKSKELQAANQSRDVARGQRFWLGRC